MVQTRKQIFVSVPALALTLFASGMAHASNDDGLEITLRPSFGSAGSKSPVVYNPDSGARLSSPPGKIYGGDASPYGAGFSGQGALGYRFIPFLSAGISAGFRNSSASAVDDATTDLARSAWMVGPYIRAYVPSKMVFGFEPWLSVGAEYVHDTQTFGQPIGPVPAKWTIVHYGVAIPIGIGVDYRFLEYFAVGPSFQYAQTLSAQGCAKAEATGFASTNLCSGDTPRLTESKTYGAWTLGLDLRVTLF